MDGLRLFSSHLQRVTVIGMGFKRWLFIPVAAMLVLAAGCPSATFIPQDGTLVFRDPFSDVLEDGWTYTGVDASKLTLAERAGFVRIYPQGGDVDPSVASSLLREFEGDFIVRTRMSFSPIVDLQLAGILVRADDGRSVALGLLTASGTGGTFRGALLRADRSGGDIGRATASIGLEDVYLRLERRGSSFIGSYSADGHAYTLLGTVSNDLPGRVKVGVGVGTAAACSQNCDLDVPADFDFFEIAVLEAP